MALRSAVSVVPNEEVGEVQLHFHATSTLLLQSLYIKA